MSVPPTPGTSAYREYKPVKGYRGIVQNLRFIAQNPCNASPFIRVAAALPALGEAFLQLMSFGLSDVLIGYAHPKPRRGWRRGSKGQEDRRGVGRDGNKRRLRGEGFPELGNELGKRLPGSQWVRGIQTSPKVWWFWIPVDLIERGMFWWMIADIVKDTTYAWASGIHKYGCDRHVTPPLDDSGYWGVFWTQTANFGILFPRPDMITRETVRNLNPPRTYEAWDFTSSRFREYNAVFHMEGIYDPKQPARDLWWSLQHTDTAGKNHEDDRQTVNLRPNEAYSLTLTGSGLITRRLRVQSANSTAIFSTTSSGYIMMDWSDPFPDPPR